MENNYYTPELSDLYIGYECEVKIGEEWEKTNLTDSIQFPHVELRLSQGRLKTPYLTKEQIEAEGWKFLHISQDLWFEKEGDFDFDNFYTSKLTMHYGAKAHIGYSDLRLTIIADDRGLDYKLFEGMCPSINEFRKITKLIRITE